MEKTNGKLYHYDTLPDHKSSIRLLKILRGPTQEDQSQSLQCMICTYYFNDMELPEYHAISYTWGDTNRTKALLLRTESKGEDYILKAPQSSEKVLRQAWQYDKGAWYWIDSICINQSNVGEKGAQVSLMGEIYSTAQRVLACVGDHSDESKELSASPAYTPPFFRHFAAKGNLKHLIWIKIQKTAFGNRVTYHRPRGHWKSYTPRHFESSAHFMLFFRGRISSVCGFTKSYILQRKLMYALRTIRFLSFHWMPWPYYIPAIIGSHQASIWFRQLDNSWRWVRHL